MCLYFFLHQTQGMGIWYIWGSEKFSLSLRQKQSAQQMEHGKYNNLEEYIRQSEPHAKVRGWAWQTAIGLQKVDGLSTSEYLQDTARQHIDGEITIEEAQKLIDTYYKSRGARTIQEDDRTEEADKVAARITELIQEESFSFTPGQITSIHRRLFDGIYKFAGKIRDYNITKKEWVLNGSTNPKCNLLAAKVQKLHFGRVGSSKNHTIRPQGNTETNVGTNRQIGAHSKDHHPEPQRKRHHPPHKRKAEWILGSNMGIARGFQSAIFALWEREKNNHQLSKYCVP